MNKVYCALCGNEISKGDVSGRCPLLAAIMPKKECLLCLKCFKKFHLRSDEVWNLLREIVEEIKKDTEKEGG